MKDFVFIVSVLIPLGVLYFTAVWILWAARKREERYISIIMDLQNRLHSKDISGYLALKDQGESIEHFPMTDDVEAKIEEMRTGALRG